MCISDMLLTFVTFGGEVYLSFRFTQAAETANIFDHNKKVSF